MNLQGSPDRPQASNGPDSKRLTSHREAFIMKTFDYWEVIGVAGALAGLVAWPGTGQAQLDLGGILPPILPAPGPAPTTSTISGQASAVTAVVLGTVTSLADTGTLVDAADP